MSAISLKQAIGGELKHAKQNAFRDQMTRGGLNRNGRTVVDEFPNDITEIRKDTDIEFDEVIARERKIVRGYIREFAKDAKRIELVERTLLYGESRVQVSRELGMKPASARSIVSRILNEIAPRP